MEQFKKYAKRFLHLHWVLVIVLCIAAAVLLVWVFLTGREQSWMAYPIYVLSFYALTVLCVRAIPAFIRMAKKKPRTVDPTEKRKDFRRSLYQGLGINAIYAVFNLVMGIIYRSTWLGSNGLYYLVLSLIRVLLVRYEQKMDVIDDPAARQRLGWRGFRLCGGLLFVLNLTMTGMVFQMIWQDMGSHYPGLMIYAVAAYTFYRLVMAIIQVISYRKNSSPIMGAARNISLTAAMMSMFSLQTAMFSTFGGEFEYEHLMNSLTGGAVCLLAVLGALGMVLHGGRKKKAIMGERK